jgi:hypothetical protein
MVTITSLVKLSGEIIFGSCRVLTCWWLFAVFASESWRVVIGAVLQFWGYTDVA